jgi:hypothetical protein
MAEYSPPSAVYPQPVRDRYSARNSGNTQATDEG